jgi:hypothetical protein
VSISDHQAHTGKPSAAFLPTTRFYRFYSIDIGGRIADHECESDSAALARGKNLLSEKMYPQVEVWLDRTRIGLIESRLWLGS